MGHRIYEVVFEGRISGADKGKGIKGVGMHSPFILIFSCWLGEGGRPSH